MEPYGRDSLLCLRSSQSNGEMIITCLMASNAKQCLSWRSLCYLLDASATPREVRYWEEEDLSYDGDSVLSGQAVVQ